MSAKGAKDKGMMDPLISLRQSVGPHRPGFAQAPVCWYESGLSKVARQHEPKHTARVPLVTLQTAQIFFGR